MVSIQTVRAHNASLKEKLGPGLVAVFVGGTSGIGLTTARALAKHTEGLSPHIYLIGRNEALAPQILSELRALNPSGKYTFLQSEDLSLLRNVDAVCERIIKSEDDQKKLNLLFMTVGIVSFKGRDETIEGLDKKLSLHYYSRMRFVHNLLPLLTAAGAGAGGNNDTVKEQDTDTNTNTNNNSSSRNTTNNNTLSRVVTVLNAGHEGRLQLDDLALKTHYSFTNSRSHAFTMSSLALSELAATYPRTTFIHAFPGFVPTGTARNQTPRDRAIFWIAFPLLRLWKVPVDESGERHLYAATSEAYPPASAASPGAIVPATNANEIAAVATGADGVPGSGAYLLDWDGSTPNKKDKLLREYRSSGVQKRVWEHTLEVFDKICGEKGGRY